MDGGKRSYDKPPGTEPPPISEPLSNAEARLRPQPDAEQPPSSVPIASAFSVPPPIDADVGPVAIRSVSPTTDHPVAAQDVARSRLEAESPTVFAAADPAPSPGEVDAGPVTPSLAQSTDDSAVSQDRPRVLASEPLVFTGERPPGGVEHHGPEAMEPALRIAYGIVFAVLALSALGLIYVHFLHHTGEQNPSRSDGVTTTLAAGPTTTIPDVPTALQSSPDAAAAALISSWKDGNRTTALTVATPVAVSTLFAAPYASGLAIDRGCSTAFSPIVCTFGPPGGASPSDPIYEVSVSESAGGWYVSSVKIEN